tara:strand:+ start:1323 stop:1562 length:240 start_codon:yes stop_codon:yes gene_type:complete
MIFIAVAVITFIIGLCLGIFISERAFDNQNWIFLKWNKDSLGYRSVSFGSKLNRGDRLLMALVLKTDSFPEEGIVYDVD